MLMDSLSTTGTVTRLGSGSKRTWDIQVGTIRLALMNLGSEDSMMFEGNFSRGHRAYCPPFSDVLESDRITIGGVIYEVKSVQDFAGCAVNYKKLYLERPK